MNKVLSTCIGGVTCIIHDVKEFMFRESSPVFIIFITSLMWFPHWTCRNWKKKVCIYALDKQHLWNPPEQLEHHQSKNSSVSHKFYIRTRFVFWQNFIVFNSFVAPGFLICIHFTFMGLWEPAHKHHQSMSWCSSSRHTNSVFWFFLLLLISFFQNQNSLYLI